MKKSIALALCLTIVLCLVPVSSFADTLLYEYPAVSAYIAPKDLSALESEYREWAYEKIIKYKDDYLLFNTPFHYYDEYYKLAEYKLWFDDTFKSSKEIDYNFMTMTEEQKDDLYLLTMLDTLEEMRETEPDFMSKYLSMSKSERWTYTLSLNGEWEKNPYLITAEAKAAAEVSEDLFTVLADSFDLGVNTFIALKSAAGEKVKLKDLAEGTTDVVTTWVKDIAKLVADNFKTKADNIVKNYLAERIVNSMMDERAADIICLKYVYLSGNNTDARAVRIAEKLVNYYESAAMENAIYSAGTQKAEELKEQALSQFNLDLQAELEVDDIVIISLIDVVKLAVKEGLDSLVDQHGEEGSISENMTGDEHFILDILNALIESMFENVKETWIETGEFQQSSIFAFDDVSDLKKVFYEINFVDIIHDVIDYKQQRKEEKDDAIKYDDLDALVLDTILWYATDLMEKEIDNYIDGMLSEEDLVAVTKEKILEHIGGFCTEIAKAIMDYMLDQEIVIANFNSLAVDVLTSQVPQPIKDCATKVLLYSNEVWSTVKSIAKDAWKVGEDILELWNDWRNYATGEDGVSFLAQEVFTARQLSEPEYGNFLSKIDRIDLILDENKVSLDEIHGLVSTMWIRLRYDAIGANAYYNVDLKGNGDEKDETLFIKLLNGGSTYYGFVSYNYKNIRGQVGLLDLNTAEQLRNVIIGWKNWSEEGWKDEWLTLPGISK